jgi:predicted Fe-S protein YdhL (DUF1289 family)
MTMNRWLLIILTAVLPAFALADDPAPPATTPAGTQPAVPGGGNPNANSTNAATPAVPGHPGDEATAEQLDDQSRGDLAARHPELSAEAKAKWEAMTPDERKAFLKEHPRMRRAMLAKKWEGMSPEERGSFCANHPELRERVRERWQALSPDERRQFVRNHPRLARSLSRGRRTHHDNGVRDHGAGEGRDGVGQGGEHRNPAGGPKPHVAPRPAASR